MQRTHAIDFETYYDQDVSIQTLGVRKYLRHPDCEIYWVSIYGPDVKYSGPVAGAPWGAFNEDSHFVAHNASFDEEVIIRGKELGIVPEWIVPESNGMECTADLSVYMQAQRSLKGAAAGLLGVRVGKDVRAKMKGKRWGEVDEEGRRAMEAYAMDDSRICFQLWNRFHERWPRHERALSLLTRTWGREGLAIDAELMGDQIRIAERIRWEAEGKIPWVKDGMPPLSPKALATWARETGIEPPVTMAEGSEAYEAWSDCYGEHFPIVEEMRKWRKSNTVLAKLKVLESRYEEDRGRYPYQLKYFGGVTGRWSGDGKFNVQNLPRGILAGVDMRKCIIAPPGKVLIAADLAQIEARVLAYLAGDEKLLDMLRSGVSIYEAHAKITMGWKGTGGKPLKTHDPRLYQLAKARVLGLGYQCGAKRFREVAKAMAGLELSEEECEETVNGFRNNNMNIVNYWRARQRDLDRAGRMEPPENFYEAVLPSGRSIKYWNLSRHIAKTAVCTLGENARSYYGGKITENIVQATARDIFAECLLRAHRAGFKVVLHVHDEMVVEADAAEAGAAAKELERIMSTPPAWWDGQRCPLEAEATIMERYAK